MHPTMKRLPLLLCLMVASSALHSETLLTLSVLPLRADAPVYLSRQARPDFGGEQQLAVLRGVKVTPVYRLSVQP